MSCGLVTHAPSWRRTPVTGLERLKRARPADQQRPGRGGADRQGARARGRVDSAAWACSTFHLSLIHI
eukprot:3167319-Alexandrium_andersonii.AAC.1